jgi:hypothetical protein
MLRWVRDRREFKRRHAEFEAHQAAVRAAYERGEAHAGTHRDIHDLVAAAAGADLEGWERIRDGAWTAPLADGIRGLVHLERLKGSSYRLNWGLSLAWVPHMTPTGTSLHRTARSAHRDLWEDGPTFVYAYIDGSVVYVPAEVERIWREAWPAAQAFFAAATTPEEVLALAERQVAEDGWAMTVHYPSPLHVVAFTQARLGRAEEARASLERELEKFYLYLPPAWDHPKARERLEKALARVLEASG